MRAGLLEKVRSAVGGKRVRVPQVHADSQVECAAASLVMVLGHHGRETSVAEAHERCQVGRDGATALDIANAARSYGLRVTPLSLELDELEDVPCPAVLHWGFSHFVVLEEYRGSHATIVDPGRGRRRVERGELAEKFTGVALGLAPGENFVREAESREEPAWRMIVRRAMRAPGARRLLTQVLLASVVLQLLGLAVPVLTKIVVDSVLPLQIGDVMTILGVGILVILATQLALSFLRGLVVVNLSAKLDAELMVGFLEHVLALPYQYFQERSTGDLLHRLSSNVQIRNVLSTQTVVAALDGLLVVVYALLLIVVWPAFGLIAVGLGLLQVLLLVVTARQMVALVSQELAAQAESESFLVESISGIEALKAAGAEDRTLAHWTGVFTGQLEASMRRGRLSVILQAVTSTVQRFSPLLLLWVGAFSVLNGSLSLGTMLALVSLAQLFLAPLASLVAAGLQLQQVGGHLDRIAFVLRASTEQAGRELHVAPRLGGHIVFEDVSFRYDDSGPWAVRGVSFEVKPGQKVALVGRTGSGKSTAAKLALGLYEPSEGQVRVDGIDLHELDLRTVRSQFGVVMQEPTVFNGTIRRNISYNDHSLPMPAVVRAARLAALHEDIERMPMGYETMIAEGGSALSGGQRQRLAIARALARDPRMLVLDEATSDLDSTTEAVVADHLERLGASSLVIAHRLSTVQAADLILVLDEGRIVERGTHLELLDAGGLYAQLVADQLTTGEEKAVG